MDARGSAHRWPLTDWVQTVGPCPAAGGGVEWLEGERWGCGYW